MTALPNSGSRWLGLMFATATMLLWGVLPVALKLLLGHMTPASIVWYRFLFASAVLGAVLAVRGRLPPVRSLPARGRLLLAGATIGLAGNYGTYMLGLDLTTPENAQVVIQLAPLLLALGALLLFHERYTRLQWCGFFTLISGLGLFFSDQVRIFAATLSAYLTGTMWTVVAAITWASYGLAQKQLQRSLSPQGILLCVYTGCALLFIPLANPAELLTLNTEGAWLLLFCAVNTLLAYGAFSEALSHWEASRVSAVLAVTPLTTFAIMWAAASLWPTRVHARPLSTAALGGALIVIAGSLITALGGARQRRPSSE